MALSNTLIAGINFAATLLSIPVIAAGIWLATQPDNSCVKLLQWPVIAIGTIALIVGLAGSIGALWRLPSLLLSYLAAMLLVILALSSLIVFIFAATGGGPGRPAPNRAYKEYRTEDYSGWLRHKVTAPGKWARIRACLRSASICAELNQTYHLAQEFFYANLSPLQSGCCKPPTDCGYTFVNPMYWISPTSQMAEGDCAQWSNDQTQLCYACDSCKAGLVANLSREWRRLDLILLLSLLALVFVYIAGCYAFRVERTDRLFALYKQGYYHS